MKKNYYGLFENQRNEALERVDKPSLLLHACCCPCSSHCLEELTDAFNVTVYFYNPNIDEADEYKKRFSEFEHFTRDAEFARNVSLVCEEYDTTPFYEMAKGMEHLPERSERCYRCYRLRMDKTAEYAKKHGFDYFTTTLSISPYKNAEWINEIGEELATIYNVAYLYSDFKKKNGYKRSIELSEEYGLYRQDYCGCVFSKAEHEKKLKQRRLSEG